MALYWIRSIQRTLPPAQLPSILSPSLGTELSAVLISKDIIAPHTAQWLRWAGLWVWVVPEKIAVSRLSSLPLPWESNGTLHHLYCSKGHPPSLPSPVPRPWQHQELQPFASSQHPLLLWLPCPSGPFQQPRVRMQLPSCSCTLWMWPVSTCGPFFCPNWSPCHPPLYMHSPGNLLFRGFQSTVIVYVCLFCKWT